MQDRVGAGEYREVRLLAAGTGSRFIRSCAISSEDRATPFYGEVRGFESLMACASSHRLWVRYVVLSHGNGVRVSVGVRSHRLWVGSGVFTAGNGVRAPVGLRDREEVSAGCRWGKPALRSDGH